MMKSLKDYGRLICAPNQKSKLTNQKSILILPELWSRVAWMEGIWIFHFFLMVVCPGCNRSGSATHPLRLRFTIGSKCKIHLPQRFKFPLLLLHARHSEVCSPKLDSIPDTRSTLSAGLDGRSRALLGWRVLELFVFFLIGRFCRRLGIISLLVNILNY